MIDGQGQGDSSLGLGSHHPMREVVRQEDQTAG